MSTEPAPARREPRNVPSLLARLSDERFSGAVVVAGGPGGVLHLRDGLVTAVETAAAPTVESVLLKSGRISEADWAAARAAAPAGGALGAALTASGLIGLPELEIACAAAVFDGAFAMALSPVTGWRVESGHPGPEVASPRGQQPDQVTAETARRLAVLRRVWSAVGEFARTPVSAPPSARSRERVTDARISALLLAINGRRTPRDLAFALGRGVFSVLVDLSRLDPAGLLGPSVPSGPPASWIAPRERPRPAAGPDRPGPLPRRIPSSSHRSSGEPSVEPND